VIGGTSQAPEKEPRRSLWPQLSEAYCSGATVCAGAFFLIALIALDIALDLQIKRAHDPLGGRFFPVLISSLLALASTAILIKPILYGLFTGTVSSDLDKAPKRSPSKPTTLSEVLSNPNARVLAMILTCVGYIASLGALGFIPSTVWALSATLFILGTRGFSGLLIAPAITTLTIYGVFTYALLVNLP